MLDLGQFAFSMLAIILLTFNCMGPDLSSVVRSKQTGVMELKQSPGLGLHCRVEIVACW